ncbi:MAG TPA: tetratricopeptide repeat protein [Bacteroidetes bacterium]|nr:tetratricopeptide repeat protein [Bacteroidota bacterium]
MLRSTRNNGKYYDAIEKYKKVVNAGETFEKTAEAHYNIGLCYTWLGKKNDAEAVFKEVLNKYPDNKEVVAFTKYGLSWVDVQKGK